MTQARNPNLKVHDVIILGAGAAGLMCAGVAGQRGRSVLVLEQARQPAEKIRISGGGRCNFTNLHTTPANFLSDNPRFCHSALSGYTQRLDFLLVFRRGIGRWAVEDASLDRDVADAGILAPVPSSPP